MSLPEFSQVHGLASSTCVRHLYQAPYEERTDRVLHLSPRLMTQSSSRTRALLTLEQNTCQYLPTLPDSWPCLMCLLVTCWVSQLQVQLDKLISFYRFFFFHIMVTTESSSFISFLLTWPLLLPSSSLVSTLICLI